VQWTVARAVGTGLIRDHLPFVRTQKGGARRRATDFHAFWEAVIAALLIGGAILLIQMNYKQVHEVYIFAGVLVLQSLPFIAAVSITLIERSAINDFATWQGLETRFGALFARRGALVKAPAPAQVEVKSEAVAQ
jgi:hypothetical protein